MVSRSEKKAYKVLSESGIIPVPELDRLFAEAEQSEELLSRLVVRSGLVKEADMLKVFGEANGTEFIPLKQTQIDTGLIEKVPVKLATYYKFFPVKLEGRKLTIAVSRMIDVNVLDEIRFGLDMDIQTVYACEGDIEEMLKRHYGLAADTVERILTQTGRQQSGADTSRQVEVENLDSQPESASVVQLVNQIILDGYQKKASDIHLEPYRGKIRLRYRVDGRLHEANVPPELKKFYSSILSRIKVMANLNIVERRLPQDGKARVRTGEQTVDLRISSIPTPHGESMVIRILPSQMILSIDDLGFDLADMIKFQELLSKPHGIIFLTGPTGSGKSTTLYAALSGLSKTESKVITIEDPVEYELEGTTQIQVQQDIGLTFGMGLRSVLRHDPDIMMVGEVRDLETADIAIRVALTGHLILSTLHTNDAASGVTRLLDIGVEPYLVASSVHAFIGQRLVRVICEHCKQENNEVLPEVKQLMAASLDLPEDDLKFYHGTGCDECSGTGFQGRIAIYEILSVNEEIRRLIFQRESSEHVKQAARRNGMKTLRENGWKKVMLGETTPEEIMRVTPVDELMRERKKKSGLRLEGSAGNDPQEPSPGISPEGRQGDASGPAPPEKETVMDNDDDMLIGDRRSYERVSWTRPLSFSSLDMEEAKGTPGPLLEGEVVDISASGVAFKTRYGVKSGEHLNIRFQLDEKQPELECMGRVVRVRRVLIDQKNPNEYIFQVALTFLAIGSEARRHIEDFVKELGNL